MRSLCLFLMAAAAAFAAEGRNIVDYRISTTLVPRDHAVVGHETLTWRNVSNDRIAELRFHLYMNAFRDKHSTWAREDGRNQGRLENNGWGEITVQHIVIAGGADLTKSIRFIHPDDDNADDHTVISVALPEPVAPGGSITLDIDFYTRLPHVVDRAGYHGDFYMVAQWFPKIGVWEAAGDRRAPIGHWNCHQYHASSEFYADYGRFDVTIKVPADYVVGATGVNVSHTAGSYRFFQEDVHDFAWSASPHFIRAVRIFNPSRETTPREVSDMAKLLGIPEDEVRLSPVRMILLIPPENASQIDRHFKILSTAIKYFGLWYGAYPYRTITLVVPPYGASQAGGMEYPTFIAGETFWLPSVHEQTPEGVIVHEFGHQYWYGLVGSNEFEESWLDEGFTTYSSQKILDQVYGPQNVPFRVMGIPLGPAIGLPLLPADSADRRGYLGDPRADSMVRNAWEYYDSPSYVRNSYYRSALTLRTLENYLGPQTMARILRTYYQRWRYRHPSTADFLDVVNQVSGRDMTRFFDQFVLGSEVLDYAVGEITSDTVRLRRRGSAVFPVELRVRFKDGAEVRRQWNGEYRWTEFKFTRPSEIASAEIDPDHKILLDVNFANNSRTRSLRLCPLVKWTENLLFWAQQLLLTVGGIS